MLRWPLHKSSEAVVDRQSRIRFHGSRLQGEIAWPHDPFYRPLIGIFVAKTLERVVPTYRRPYGRTNGAWLCSVDIDLHDFNNRRNEMEVVCLETADILYKEARASENDPTAPLEISDLIDLADGKKKPWDCSGFPAFLDFSIPDQVDFIYYSILERRADPSGMEVFRQRIENGDLTILDLRDAMVSSDEFQNNVKKSIYSRLSHWLVWGGLKDVHSCLVQNPVHAEPSSAFNRRIEPGLTSIAVSAPERISEKVQIGSWLARIALGSNSDQDLRLRWEREHSGLISEMTRQVEARKSARKAKVGESGPLLFNGLLGSMRIGEAGRAIDDRIASRPGANGFIFYGPYMRLGPGCYQLNLRLHADKTRDGDHAVITVEAVYNELLLGWLSIGESAYSLATHVLKFEVPEKAGLVGSRFEFRLRTNGVADIDVFDLSLERQAIGGEATPAADSRNWLSLLSIGDAGEATTEGIRGKAGIEGHLFYGPYRALLPSKYVIAVDYESRGGRGASLQIETVDAIKGVLASRKVAAEEGVSSLELFFTIQQPKSATEQPPPLEFRLAKSARADVLVKAVRVKVV